MCNSLTNPTVQLKHIVTFKPALVRFYLNTNSKLVEVLIHDTKHSTLRVAVGLKGEFGIDISQELLIAKHKGILSASNTIWFWHGEK